MDYRFSCQNCHYCCSTEPGYVFLSKSEIEDLSSYVGLSFDEFIEIYCRKVNYGLYSMVSLKEKENYDCIFLSKEGCKVYPARPLQCRTYPFWRGIADNEESWNEEAKGCPGMNKGRLYSKSEIDEMLKKGDENIPYVIMH